MMVGHMNQVFLKLDCSRIKKVFGWKPKWNIETAIEKVVEWFSIYIDNGDVDACINKQIYEFLYK